MKLGATPDSDKSVSISVQNCVGCLDFKRTQLYAFFSRGNHSELF